VASSFNNSLPFVDKTSATLIAAAISVALTLLCAVPLAWIDRIWTRMLGAMTRPMLKRVTPAAHGADRYYAKAQASGASSANP
jgi:hypothetical protein